MALRSGSLPNFINGVSQQTPSLRLASQAEEQINCYPTLLDGLKKRPSLRHVARLMNEPVGSLFVHTINRDAVERYNVIIQNGDLRVFDLNGVEKTVNFPDGKTYLNSADPRNFFRAVTIADYTFIVNKGVIAAMKSGSNSPTRPFEGLFYVKVGNQDRQYQIVINGSAIASHTAAGGAGLDTTTIAAALKTAFQGAMTNPPWTITQYNSSLYIVNSSVDFALAAIDGFGGLATSVAKDKIQHFSDLPVKGPAGFVVEVAGDENNQFDNYYVELEAAGTWKETVKPNIAWEIDNATMPHQLVRNVDGTFTFKRATWDKRLVGDTVTNAQPSFIGRTIADIFFHRNRLGLVADENVIMSASGEFFRFWRKTVTAVLDDDPIDVAVSHTKVSIIRHAVPYRDLLILFSDQTQFSLHTAQNAILTPKTIDITPTTELPCTQYARPAATSDVVFFLADGASIRVYRYELDPDTQALTGNPVTDHVSSYIPAAEGLASKVAVSAKYSILAVNTDAQPSRLYLYQWHVQQRQLLQSAWHYWDVGTGAVIRGMEFIDSDLCLIIARDGGIWFERINVDPKKAEDFLTYWIHLDRRISAWTQLSAPTYDSVNDLTNYTLPYTATSDVKAVLAQDGFDSGGAIFAGMPKEVVARGPGGAIALKGDTSSSLIYFGKSYRATYKFSPILPKKPTKNGEIALSDARLQLRYLSIIYAEHTAEWMVNVTPYGRPTYSYVLGGYALGTSSSDKPPADRGTFRVPIMSKSDDTVIELISDSHLPGSFVSADWEGQLFLRATPAG